MARRNRRRHKPTAPSVEYRDDEDNVLALRGLPTLAEQVPDWAAMGSSPVSAPFTAQAVGPR